MIEQQCVKLDSVRGIIHVAGKIKKHWNTHVHMHSGKCKYFRSGQFFGGVSVEFVMSTIPFDRIERNTFCIIATTQRGFLAQLHNSRFYVENDVLQTLDFWNRRHNCIHIDYFDGKKTVNGMSFCGIYFSATNIIIYIK